MPQGHLQCLRGGKGPQSPAQTEILVMQSLNHLLAGTLKRISPLSLQEGVAHEVAHCTGTCIYSRTVIQHIPARNYLQTNVIHQAQPRKNPINMQQTS